MSEEPRIIGRTGPPLPPEKQQNLDASVLAVLKVFQDYPAETHSDILSSIYVTFCMNDPCPGCAFNYIAENVASALRQLASGPVGHA